MNYRRIKSRWTFLNSATPRPSKVWGNPFQNPPKKLVDRSPLYFRLASSAAVIKNSFHCIFDVQEHKIQRTGVRPAGRYFIFSGSCCQSSTLHPPPSPYPTPPSANRRRRPRWRRRGSGRSRRIPWAGRATLPRCGVTGTSVNTNFLPVSLRIFPECYLDSQHRLRSPFRN